MKKIILLISMLIVSLNLFSQDAKDQTYTLVGIPKMSHGIYLPSKYIMELKKLKSHQLAMKSLKNMGHDNLIVKAQRISGIDNYHDGYAINQLEYEDFNLDDIEDGILIDNSGNKYFKISNSNIDPYKVIQKYILGVIITGSKYRTKDGGFLELVKNGSKIDMNSMLYQIRLDTVFAPPADLEYIWTDGKVFGLKNNKEIIEIYELSSATEGPGFGDNTKLLYKFDIQK